MQPVLSNLFFRDNHLAIPGYVFESVGLVTFSVQPVQQLIRPILGQGMGRYWFPDSLG